jgi:hypothetical protein
MTESATRESISALLLKHGFAEYDAGAADPMGFRVYAAELLPRIVVEVLGANMASLNPGEGPRALLDDYAKMISAAGYETRVVGAYVIVTTSESTSGSHAEVSR